MDISLGKTFSTQHELNIWNLSNKIIQKQKFRRQLKRVSESFHTCGKTHFKLLQIFTVFTDNESACGLFCQSVFWKQIR